MGSSTMPLVQYKIADSMAAASLKIPPFSEGIIPESLKSTMKPSASIR